MTQAFNVFEYLFPQAIDIRFSFWSRTASINSQPQRCSHNTTKTANLQSDHHIQQGSAPLRAHPHVDPYYTSKIGKKISACYTSIHAPESEGFIRLPIFLSFSRNLSTHFIQQSASPNPLPLKSKNLKYASPFQGNDL